MAVIAIAALKGGVGKTLTSLHLAHGLALAGFQTLLIDCDPSSNASKFLSRSRSINEPGIISFLTSAGAYLEESDSGNLSFVSVPADAIDFEVRPRMDLLPGNGFEVIESLEEMTSAASRHKGQRSLNLLGDAIKGLTRTYNFIVLDCSPSLDLLTKNALAASDLVLSPVDSGAMSIEGLCSLMNFTSQLQNAPYLLVLRSLVHRSANRTRTLLDDQLEAIISDRESSAGVKTGYHSHHKAGILETIIHRVEIANQLSYQRQTTFDTNGNNSLREDYDMLVKEILYYTSIVVNSSEIEPASNAPAAGYV